MLYILVQILRHSPGTSVLFCGFLLRTWTIIFHETPIVIVFIFNGENAHVTFKNVYSHFLKLNTVTQLFYQLTIAKKSQFIIMYHNYSLPKLLIHTQTYLNRT